MLIASAPVVLQAQSHSVVTLSSSSDSSPNNSPTREEDSNHEEPAVDVLQDREHNQDAVLIDGRGEPPANKARRSKASKSKKNIEDDTLGKGITMCVCVCVKRSHQGLELRKKKSEHLTFDFISLCV